MFINDGRVVRKIIGGYSPKIYDGKVLELNRDVFENIFAGATIVGDQHFQWGKKNLKGHCSYAYKKQTKKREA